MACLRDCDICQKFKTVRNVKDKGLICIECEKPDHILVGEFMKVKTKQYVFDFYWTCYDIDFNERKELDNLYKNLYNALIA